MHGFRSRLRGGETLLGTMLTLPSPAVADILAGAGFDWLFIDGEHGPLETADLEAVLRAAGRDTACLVRVPEAAEVPIKKALDLGADGIIAPQVNTPAQAADVARSWTRSCSAMPRRRCSRRSRRCAGTERGGAGPRTDGSRRERGEGASRRGPHAGPSLQKLQPAPRIYKSRVPRTGRAGRKTGRQADRGGEER